jgi:hypothetical protein
MLPVDLKDCAAAVRVEIVSTSEIPARNGMARGLAATIVLPPSSLDDTDAGFER